VLGPSIELGERRQVWHRCLGSQKARMNLGRKTVEMTYREMQIDDDLSVCGDRDFTLVPASAIAELAAAERAARSRRGR
jgi:hypothetical protein